MPYVAPVFVAPVAPPRIGGAVEVPSFGPTLGAMDPASEGASGEVAARRTPMSTGGIRQALAGAYRRLHGRNVSARELDVLTAHVAHETARGDRMFNYNFGGIKGAGPSGLTARYQTTEVLDGEHKKLVDGFRAYRSPTEGALDYLKLLDERFPSAARAAREGDVSGFSAALKRAHYYTADEEGYTRALRALAHEAPGGSRALARPYGAAAVPGLGSVDARVRSQVSSGAGAGYLYGRELGAEGFRLDGGGPHELPTALEVSRVLGAVRALDPRLAAPLDEGGADRGRDG